MKMEDLAALWMAETERAIGLVQHDFICLDEKQLNYKVHVSHCNISQIMQHVLSTNCCLFTCIERAIPGVKSTGNQEEYSPGYLGKYILNRMSFTRCIPKRIAVQHAELQVIPPEILFSKIIGQQNRIKELVTLCKSLDMNRRVVPFWLFGLIKLSIAETFDYLILNQKNHFIMARHILILQQI